MTLTSTLAATVVLLLALVMPQSWAYPNFNKHIPNGDKVKYEGEPWPAVGHLRVFGGGELNVFGKDFMRHGNEWTPELCRMDSDGDGRSNGEELGDPECIWLFGKPLPKTRFITHPGIPDECPSPAPAPSILRVAILGAGAVGKALGKQFSGANIPTTYGVRDIGAHHGDPAYKSPLDAVRDATVVFLTVPGNAVQDVAKELASALRGKVVVDCTNPFTWDKGPVWTPPPSGSNTAELAKLLPESRLVKAFNTFGVEHMEVPGGSGLATQVLMAGDDAGAKKVVSQICERANFLPVDAGPLRNAGALENMAAIWVHLATVGGRGREFIITTYPQQ